MKKKLKKGKSKKDVAWAKEALKGSGYNKKAIQRIIDISFYEPGRDEEKES